MRSGLHKRYILVPLLLLALLSAAAGAANRTAEIRYVIDGDTVVLADGQHVRLIGINAPELGKDGAPNQPVAARARVGLAALVEKRHVTLVLGRERHDHYGRLLAHLLLPRTRHIGDPMAGFFMLRRSVVSGGAPKPSGFKIPAGGLKMGH